jgi:hypothetical protein
MERIFCRSWWPALDLVQKLMSTGRRIPAMVVMTRAWSVGHGSKALRRRVELDFVTCSKSSPSADCVSGSNPAASMDATSRRGRTGSEHAVPGTERASCSTSGHLVHVFAGDLRQIRSMVVGGGRARPRPRRVLSRGRPARLCHGPAGDEAGRDARRPVGGSCGSSRVAIRASRVSRAAVSRPTLSERSWVLR